MIVKWWRRCRRRKPGIYLARTEKHLRPGRYENGYVGKSVNVEIRKRQHLGQVTYSTELGHSVPVREVDRLAGAAPMTMRGKPWADLRPRWRVLRLPWWLGWPWILLPLEALAITLCLPRYNDKLNRHNPRRVTISDQHRQRAERDGETGVVYLKRRAVRWSYVALRVAGALCIASGAVGWMLTR